MSRMPHTLPALHPDGHTTPTELEKVKWAREWWPYWPTLTAWGEVTWGLVERGMKATATGEIERADVDVGRVAGLKECLERAGVPEGYELRMPEGYGWPEERLKQRNREDGEEKERVLKWVYAYGRYLISEERVRERVRQAAGRVARVCEGGTPLFLWSGGKDGIILQGIVELMGYEDRVRAYASHGKRELTFETCERFWRERGPEGLEIERYGLTLEDVAEARAVKFLDDGRHEWFIERHLPMKWKMHRAAARERGLDRIMTGRRVLDGNYCGKGGVSESGSMRVYAPLYDWTTEMTLAAAAWMDRQLPECYRWPKGFVIGPDEWWLYAPHGKGSVRGWETLWSVEPEAVEKGARVFEGARQCLRRRVQAVGG